MGKKITIEQIRAARAMKGWGQVELAERSGLTQVTVANIESGKSRGSRESLSSIATALENAGIEFVDNGVRLASNFVTTIDGRNAYSQLLEDVYFSLRPETEGILGPQEVLFFCANEERSSPEVNATLRKLRKIGIRFRSLVAKGDSYLLGSLEEYREMPGDFVLHEVVVIYSDKVGLLVEHKPYRVLLVKNYYLSEDYRRMFEYFWSVGGRPTISTAKERYDSASGQGN